MCSIQKEKILLFQEWERERERDRDSLKASCSLPWALHYFWAMKWCGKIYLENGLNEKATFANSTNTFLRRTHSTYHACMCSSQYESALLKINNLIYIRDLSCCDVCVYYFSSISNLFHEETFNYFRKCSLLNIKNLRRGRNMLNGPKTHFTDTIWMHFSLLPPQRMWCVVILLHHIFNKEYSFAVLLSRLLKLLTVRFLSPVITLKHTTHF